MHGGGGGCSVVCLFCFVFKNRKKSRCSVLFDSNAKSNIVYSICFPKMSFPVRTAHHNPGKVFISAYSAHSGNYANNTYILGTNQQSIQSKVQCSHLLLGLQLQLELPASPQSVGRLLFLYCVSSVQRYAWGWGKGPAPLRWGHPTTGAHICPVPVDPTLS